MVFTDLKLYLCITITNEQDTNDLLNISE